MKSQQSGFAHAFLIIGLILALIGALGFVFWQNFIYEEPVVTKVENVVVKSEQKKQAEAPAATSVINEYDVQFEIPTELKDTTIKYEKRNIGEASFLAITTQRVVDVGGDCSAGYPFGDIVRLSRETQKQSGEFGVHVTEKVGDYYYQIDTVESSGLTPASECLKNTQARKDMNALVDALKKIKTTE